MVESSILLWKVFTLFLKRPFYHLGNIYRTYTRNNIIFAPFNTEKDISFEMTIHQMAFDEYTSNTFCMVWQIARMQVPCKMIEFKKFLMSIFFKVLVGFKQSASGF